MEVSLVAFQSAYARGKGLQKPKGRSCIFLLRVNDTGFLGLAVLVTFCEQLLDKSERKRKEEIVSVREKGRKRESVRECVREGGRYR